MIRRGRLVASVLAVVIAGVLFAPAANASTRVSARFVLGIVSISPSESGNYRFITGARREAQAKGWSVIVIDAHGSADDANAAFENLAQRKVNGIIDMVFPTTSLAAGLRAAALAHIPVETWGGGLGPDVVAANGEGGPFARIAVARMIKDLHGHGAVLALTYHTGLVCREREAVFDRMLTKYPGIKVTKDEVRIPGYFQDGAQFATAWLAGHPQGSGNLAIWGCWDDPALGAVSALRQDRRTDVKVYGQNGGSEALTAIQAGNMTATAWENSTAEGAQMVDVLQQAIAAGSRWRPRVFVVPGVLVDRTNVKRYLSLK